MVALYLLRHAKSSWDDPALDDHDRPLNNRGRRAADMIGAEMAKRRLKPDLVLCSTALRARETLDRILPHLGTVDISHERGLYLASRSRIVSRLKHIDDGIGRALVVGHEPGIGATAVALAGPDSDPEACRRMTAKYPTGALAVIDFPDIHWSDLRAGAGILKSFIVPKSLD